MQFQILECAIRKIKQHEGKESDKGEKKVLFQVGLSLLTTPTFRNIILDCDILNWGPAITTWKTPEELEMQFQPWTLAESFHRPQGFHDKPYLQDITSNQRNTWQDSMTSTVVDTSKMEEWRYEQLRSERHKNRQYFS